jgi:hypothetical protein
MTTTVRPTAEPQPATPAGVGMTSVRKTALVAGVLYIVTFASSIPAAFILIDPVLANADFMTRPGIANPLLVGSFLDLINALAAIGTAVALFPLLKRQHEGFALGFVTTRMFEAAVIVIGVISLLTAVTVYQGAASADAASLVTTGTTLAATYHWVFILGPILMSALNALLLGTLMYRSRLVPRAIPVMGLIGAPLMIASFVALFFGVHETSAPTHFLAAAPIFLWELSLGFYMAVKGFKPSPITSTSGA